VKTPREQELEDMTFRLGSRIADLLEILRLWEPDYSSAEHRRLIYFARCAQRDSQALLTGVPVEGAGPVEQRIDQARSGG
jgi:hypothetical protein